MIARLLNIQSIGPQFWSLCLAAAILTSCAAAPNETASETRRFTSVAMALHQNESISPLARQQIIFDLGVALTQRGTFGRVLSAPPAQRVEGLLLIDIRILNASRQDERIDLSAQVDLVNFATGVRLRSFVIGASGTRDAQLGLLSISVIGDLIEQIADTVTHSPPL